MGERVTIKIPKELYSQLQELIRGTGFSSVTELIVFVMRTVVSSGNMKETSRLTDEEVSIIKERLKRLGYL